jgi:dihydroflavonol-4-reductase
MPPEWSVPLKILLTGASGFLGEAVTRQLAEAGHRLIALHRPSSSMTRVKVFLSGTFTADITDPLVVTQAAQGMDAVVHMAADLSHWHARRERIVRTNVIGTRIVAEAAKTAGVPLLIHTSSIAAVGYSADGVPINESAPNNFSAMNLVYHDSKRLAEEEALDARRYGVRVVILNPGVLYGPRPLEHPFGHTMLELAAGKVPGHPSGGLSIADVDDVACAFAAALERGRDGTRYLLAGENVTYRAAFEAQANAAGARYAGRTLPAAALFGVAAAFEAKAKLDGNEPRFGFDHAKLAPLNMWYDSTRAESELAFKRRSLEKTLERMARAYRDSGALPG